MKRVIQLSNNSTLTRDDGFTLVGYFGTPTGLGQMARNVLELIESAGIPVQVENVSTQHETLELLAKVNSRSSTPHIRFRHVLSMIPGEFWITELFHQERVDIRSQHVTAIWAWELEELPDFFKKTLRYADQIFAISDFSRIALEKGLGREVQTFPTYGNNPRKLTSTIDEGVLLNELKELGVPESYILCRFDAKSFIRRKNPEAVLELWDQIHSEYPDLFLLLKTTDLMFVESSELRTRISNSPKVIVLDLVLSHALNTQLMKSASVYISLHRAEGLGLNILEAISVDTPAVFTGYSGITKEVEEIGFPVSYSIGKIGVTEGPYPGTSTWAEPDIADAVRQTRRALEQVKSGEWQRNQANRVDWIDNFYRDSISTALQMLRHTLTLQKTSLAESRRFIVRVFKILNRLWWHLPEKVRKSISPVARPLYRKFLL